MIRRNFATLTIIVLTFASVAPMKAAPTTSAVAQPPIYRLDDTSLYEKGCFPPCLCPIFQTAGMRGTFILTPAASESGYRVWSVRDVSLLVPTGDQELYITGSGKLRIGGSPARHRLELDLTLSDEPDVTQHFDSGWQEGNAGFPHLSITVSLHGLFCFDTALTIDATRVQPSEIVNYRLDGTQSTYQQGCFDPCECPLGPELALIGRFGLVEIKSNPIFVEYAVVNVTWSAVWPGSPTPLPPIRIRGFGFYNLGGEVAVTQRLSLDLRSNNGPLTHFDSGWEIGGYDFPHIDSTVSINGIFCYDTVMHVVADPE